MWVLWPQSCPDVCHRQEGWLRQLCEGLKELRAAQGLAVPGFCIKGKHYLYSPNPAVSAALLPPRAGSWVMLWAVCKSRPLDHMPEITAKLWRLEAQLFGVVLGDRGPRGQQQPSLAIPGQDAAGGAVASGGRVRIHQPPGAYSTSLLTRSRRAGSSCPPPLLPFVFFCFLLLETEHLMEKACSPPRAGDPRFLPTPPGTAPGSRCPGPARLGYGGSQGTGGARVRA